MLASVEAQTVSQRRFASSCKCPTTAEPGEKRAADEPESILILTQGSSGRMFEERFALAEEAKHALGSWNATRDSSMANQKACDRFKILEFEIRTYVSWLGKLMKTTLLESFVKKYIYPHR